MTFIESLRSEILRFQPLATDRWNLTLNSSPIDNNISIQKKPAPAGIICQFRGYKGAGHPLEKLSGQGGAGHPLERPRGGPGTLGPTGSSAPVHLLSVSFAFQTDVHDVTSCRLLHQINESHQKKMFALKTLSPEYRAIHKQFKLVYRLAYITP